MAARSNAVGTEKSVKYAIEAAKYRDVPGLSADTRRKLDILRTGLVLPAPTTEGAATELNEIATDLSSQYGKGKGTLGGKPISGSDIEAELGHLDHTPAEYAAMWTRCPYIFSAPMTADFAKMVVLSDDRRVRNASLCT